MTRTILMAATAMLAMTAGAVDAKPMKGKGASSQVAATRQLNEQQLASINNGTPGMASSATMPNRGMNDGGMASGTTGTDAAPMETTGPTDPNGGTAVPGDPAMNTPTATTPPQG